MLAAILARPTRSGRRYLAEQVQTAIDRAVTYLKRQQNNNGTWPDHPGNIGGGITALCTLALLNAGVPPDDEKIQKSLIVLARPHASADLRRGAADDGLLRRRAEERPAADSPEREVAGRQPDHQRPRAREPGPIRPSAAGDPSNSQFALLALYEAERAGVKVNEKTWRLALQYWQQMQNPDGSWSYNKGLPPAPAA